MTDAIHPEPALSDIRRQLQRSSTEPAMACSDRLLEHQIAERMRVRGIQELAEYRSLLQEDSGEVLELRLAVLAEVEQELSQQSLELGQANADLVAANQELYRINAQHVGKIRRLEEVAANAAQMLDRAGVAAVLLDRDLRLSSASLLAREMFGIQDDQLGKPMAELPGFVQLARIGNGSAGGACPE